MPMVNIFLFVTLFATHANFFLREDRLQGFARAIGDVLLVAIPSADDRRAVVSRIAEGYGFLVSDEAHGSLLQAARELGIAV